MDPFNSSYFVWFRGSFCRFDCSSPLFSAIRWLEPVKIKSHWARGQIEQGLEEF
jgi:hypothetical protein